MTSPFTILCLSLIATATATADADEKLTAYDSLQTFNFPIGILPKGALGYDLEEKTGKFRAYLNGSCSFSLEGSYQLKYKPTISGIISKNRLANLSGVSVKVVLWWLNIVEVRRVGDELEFSVGIAFANFPIDNFYECPQCGCGLDCNSTNVHVRKIKMNSLASSI